MHSGRNSRAGRGCQTVSDAFVEMFLLRTFGQVCGQGKGARNVGKSIGIPGRSRRYIYRHRGPQAGQCSGDAAAAVRVHLALRRRRRPKPARVDGHA